MLTVVHSSSLERLKSPNNRLERKLGEIEALVNSVGGEVKTGNDQEGLSAAEIGNRKWSAIGVDEWIQAGKWWLMKVGRCCARATPLPSCSNFRC